MPKKKKSQKKDSPSLKALLEQIEKRPLKVLASIIAFALLLLVPIYILYKIPAPYSWMDSPWDASDILSYIAAIMALIGTLVLGYAAYRQGERANDMNEKLVEIENRKHLDINCPKVEIKNLYISKSTQKEADYVFELSEVSMTNEEMTLLSPNIENLILTVDIESKYSSDCFFDAIMLTFRGDNPDFKQIAYRNMSTHFSLHPGEKRKLVQCKFQFPSAENWQDTYWFLSLVLTNHLHELYECSIRFTKSENSRVCKILSCNYEYIDWQREDRIGL